MDVSKLTAALVFQSRTPVADAEHSAPQPDDALTVESVLDIRPLDVPGALQILMAEVRLALTALLATAPIDVPAPSEALAPANPTQAAHAVVDMLLQALPQDVRDAAAWSASVEAVEVAVQQGFDDAERTIGNWRDTPPSIVDAPRMTRLLLAAVLSDESANPLWLRPEWLRLAPRLTRYVRRRRNARRRLSDPDFSHRGLDDADWDC